MTLTTVSQNQCFGGVQGVYSHASPETGCTMRFGLFLPPQAKDGLVPVLYWLSGLTCTEENFIVKAGAQRVAAELGIVIVAPDTSPRGDDVPDDAAIASPMRCPWGEKALAGYLGEDRDAWRQYDATALIESRGWKGPPLLVDQGTKDQFLDTQLKPELLREACTNAGVALDLRLREGYDHSYFFIASFIEEHLRFHARHLAAHQPSVEGVLQN